MFLEFVEGNFTFDEEKAEDFVDKFRSRWPEVENLTAQRIIQLHEGLSDSAEVLEYRLLRSFVAEGVHRVMTGDVSEIDVKGLVDDVIHCARRMMPLAECTPAISCAEKGSLYVTLRNKLKEICRSGEIFDEKLKALCGDVALENTDHTVYDYWGKFADSTDTDAARAAFFHVVRYFVTEHRHKYTGLDDMVKEVLEVLEKLEIKE